MKNAILLILVLILSSCASKKSIDRKVNTKYKFSEIVKQFDKKNLNYIGFKKKCVGGVLKEPNKNDCKQCYSKNNIYIFWTDNEKSYVQKFDNCSEFNIIEIFDFKPSEFLKNNTEKLQTEKVRKYKIDKDTYASASHSCFRSFLLNDGKSKYENKYDFNDLTGKNDNLNYQINNNLKLVELEKILNGIIKKLEKENQFKRNKKTCYNTV
jgi:hypothetical protein